MKNKKSEKESCEGCNCQCKRNNNSAIGAVYGLGFIGAAIYYISNSTTFLGLLFSIFKSLVWPAFLVFEILKFLSA